MYGDAEGLRHLKVSYECRVSDVFAQIKCVFASFNHPFGVFVVECRDVRDVE